MVKKAAIFTLMSLFFALSAYANWNIEDVDYCWRAIYYPSIDIDSSGFPHILYADDFGYWVDPILTLRYAHYDGSSWHLEDVDGFYSANVGHHCSMKIDSCNNLHVSYFDASNRTLKYAYRTNSIWEIAIIDDDRINDYTSLCLDSYDHPHIAYRSGRQLHYIHWDGNSWHKELVDVGVDNGHYCSIAIDSDNFPHISYFDEKNDELRYAKKHESGWDIQLIDSDGRVGIWSSLAVDSNSNPHISYATYNNYVSDLFYAHFNGSDWVKTKITDDFSYCYTSICIGNDDMPIIAYYGESFLKCLNLFNDKWINRLVDKDSTFYLSATTDHSGIIHIAYATIPEGKLKYAKESALTGTELWMPFKDISPDSYCACKVIVQNSGTDMMTENPLFVILDVYGNYYFAPSFNNFDYYTASFAPGRTLIAVLDEFHWSEGLGSGQAIFYSAITDAEITEIVGEMSTLEFEWSE